MESSGVETGASLYRFIAVNPCESIVSNPVQSRKASAPDENRTLIDELVSIAATGDVKQRLRVIKRVADLFMIGSRGYTDAQIALFDDVLRELAIDIEVKAREIGRAHV